MAGLTDQAVDRLLEIMGLRVGKPITVQTAAMGGMVGTVRGVLHSIAFDLEGRPMSLTVRQEVGVNNRLVMIPWHGLRQTDQERPR